jgi:hypothetical protein
MPSLHLMIYRAKKAEREVVLTSVHRSMEDYYARDGKFPQPLGGNDSRLDLTSANPDDAPGMVKRGWRYTATGPTDDWNKLSMFIDGAVYYSYGGYAQQVGNTVTYYLYAKGDLDGDGTPNTWEKYWTFSGGVQTFATDSTLYCGDCSAAYETFPNAM